MKQKDLGVINLIEVLQNLQGKTSYGAKGKEFEDSIASKLRLSGFIEVNFKKKSNKYIAEHLKGLTTKEFENQYRKQIKDMVVNDKNNVEILTNPLKQFFNENIYIYIYQPFGSQNFPDFLVITQNWLIPIETKFSTKKQENNSVDNNSKNKKTNSLPKWNSNIPKANTIYLFANNQHLTFFVGNDYLDTDVRVELIKHFESFDEENKLNILKDKLKNDYQLKVNNNQKSIGNPTGIYPSIRIDFLTRNDFKFGDKVFNSKEHQNGIFDFAKENNWEQNVFDFLNSLKEVDVDTTILESDNKNEK